MADRLMNVISTIMHEAGFVVADREPAAEMPKASIAEPPAPDEWGTSPEAVAGQDAFMGLGR